MWNFRAGQGVLVFLMETLLYDLRFGLMRLRKSPAFTLAAVLTLALGIGANVTIFSWLNAVILNPLARVDSRGLASVRWHTAKGSDISFSWPDYLDLRQRSRTIQGLGVGSMGAISLSEGANPERIWGMLVSSNFFGVLDVKPVLGRTFGVEADTPGNHAEILVSHRLWQERFGGDPALVGREIRVNNRPMTVIGVLPEGFQGPVPGLRLEYYLPVTMREVIYGPSRALAERGAHWLQGYARLSPGADRRQVEAELTAISAQLAREFAHADDYARAELVPVWREGGGAMLAPIVMLMMGVVAVVLLIACANVANLLLARGAVRRREIAIRQALGVTRTRLVRELLVESTLLSLLGGMAAMVVVPFVGSMLMSFAPVSDFPVWVQVSTDARLFGFTLGLSVGAVLLFGLAPALRASRPDVMAAIKDESGGSTSPRRAWLRNALVVTQVALSMMLLVGAGLLLKSLGRAAATDPGFDARNVLVAAVDLFPSGYDAPRGAVALNQMTAKIAALPEVTAVSTVRRIPLGLGGSSTSWVEVEGYVPSKNEEMLSLIHNVGAGYFHAIRTPLVTGRDFSPADDAKSQLVVVVNQTFANRYFPNADPIGRRVKLFGEFRSIAGVARDSKFRTLDERPGPAVYLPVAQKYVSDANFIVRTSGDPMTLARAVEGAIHAVDPALPVHGVRPLDASIATAYFAQKMGGSMMGLFGGLALVLAAVGLYGVLAYNVTQRSREVGIRMALGAARADVLRMILGQGLRFAGIGVAIGLALSVAVTRLMTKLLFGVSPLDAPVIAGVAVMLGLVAVSASLAPAWRASRINPIRAIRWD